MNPDRPTAQRENRLSEYLAPDLEAAGLTVSGPPVSTSAGKATSPAVKQRRKTAVRCAEDGCQEYHRSAGGYCPKHRRKVDTNTFVTAALLGAVAGAVISGPVLALAGAAAAVVAPPAAATHTAVAKNTLQKGE